MDALGAALGGMRCEVGGAAFLLGSLRNSLSPWAKLHRSPKRHPSGDCQRRHNLVLAFSAVPRNPRRVWPPSSRERLEPSIAPCDDARRRLATPEQGGLRREAESCRVGAPRLRRGPTQRRLSRSTTPFLGARTDESGRNRLPPPSDPEARCCCSPSPRRSGARGSGLPLGLPLPRSFL